MNKAKFNSELLEKLEKEKYTMPFWACGKDGKGHPLEARLLFVGFNPSSAPPKGKEWLNYWDAEEGFDMTKYQKDQPKVSKTRKNIVSVAEATLSATSLGTSITYANTNVHWVDSKRKKDLKNPIPGELRWLIEWLPKGAVIIAHGKNARDALREIPSVIPFHHLSGLGLPKGVYFKDELSKLKTLVSAGL